MKGKHGTLSLRRISNVESVYVTELDKPYLCNLSKVWKELGFHLHSSNFCQENYCVITQRLVQVSCMTMLCNPGIKGLSFSKNHLHKFSEVGFFRSSSECTSPN